MWELDYKDSRVLKNWCFWTVVLEKTLGVSWIAGRSNQSILKEISLEFHWKDWWWSWNSNTLATWWEELTHWKRPWCWKRLKAEGEGIDRGWDGWMASLTQWTSVWASSRSWWWPGKLAVLQSMGLQRVSDWTETEWSCHHILHHISGEKHGLKQQLQFTISYSFEWHLVKLFSHANLLYLNFVSAAALNSELHSINHNSYSIRLFPTLPGTSPGWSRVFEGETARRGSGNNLIKR